MKCNNHEFLVAQKEENMKNKKGIIIGIVALIVVILAGVGIYAKFGPKTTSGSKAYTLTVVSADGSETSYEGSTDAEVLHDLMNEISESQDFSFEGSNGDYGFFIETINGETADTAAGAYWAIYVNDEYGMYGVDEQPVADGDNFKLAYEVYEAEE